MNVPFQILTTTFKVNSLTSTLQMGKEVFARVRPDSKTQGESTTLG